MLSHPVHKRRGERGTEHIGMQRRNLGATLFTLSMQRIEILKYCHNTGALDDGVSIQPPPPLALIYYCKGMKEEKLPCSSYNDGRWREAFTIDTATRLCINEGTECYKALYS